MKNDLDIKGLLILLGKKWKLVVVCILFFTCIGGYTGSIIKPQYEAKMDILVNYTTKSDDSTQLQTNEIEMSLRLIETYKYMLKSDSMLSKVISQLEKPYKKASLINNISIESMNNSQIITIIGREKTPEMAAELVNTYAIVFQEEIKSLMNLDNINILNAVSVETDIKEIKPDFIMFILISFVIGNIMAIIIVLIQEFYFGKLNSVLKMENTLGIPSLGVIPTIKKKVLYKSAIDRQSKKLIFNYNSPIIETEEFRVLRANVQFQMAQKKTKTILVTSPVSGDGKTIVSGNLAVIFAMSGKRTIVIDGDLRKPIGEGLFSLPQRIGLTSFVSGHYGLENIIQETDTKNLSFIGTGPIPPNPAEIFSSNEMGWLIEELKTQFDVIIIDTPSLVVADAISLATVVDGCLYVIDAMRAKEGQASNGLEQLEKVGATILGTILNRSYSSSGAVANKF